MLVRYGQARRMLELIQEAREIGLFTEQSRHLAAGIHGIVGAAMTTIATIRDADGRHQCTLEHEMSTPSDINARRIIAAVRTNRNVSTTFCQMRRRLYTTPTVTARRRDLVSDHDWYRSESFNELHRSCGYDDHIYSFRATGGGRIHAIGIRRALGDRPYDEHDRNLIELFHEEVVRIQQRPKGSEGPQLAPRERAVLARLLRGASEKQVAADLNLSQHTVHSYTKSIYSAYRVSSRAELLVRCLAS
ncbi:MAG TPA: LuxR C-terminal-related transcriptional regulator [Gemmatimonadales bacterium]|nr:LuxR C-terminal-related transcriptional regulator [Gemmatimonadales bacterium]